MDSTKKRPEGERFPVRRNIRLTRSVYQQGHCFFITIGTHERHAWFDGQPAFNQQIVDVLTQTTKERTTQLYAWCLMPDHAHLLVQDPDVVEFVRLFKGRSTSPARRYKSGRRLWQRSFYDHGLRREESVETVAKYIFENPVRAGLVENPAEYPWSGSSVWPNWRESYQG
jgi:putative transposase